MLRTDANAVSSAEDAQLPSRRATYRLQLHAGFGFDAAASVADYLARLGISHVYTSPYLQAARGSTHGYDVVDHARVNDELGGPAAHRRFVDSLRARRLGHLLDVVPNHMAISDGNAWWWDVLENGPASDYATHFDVDWDPPESRLRNVVLLPVLPEHYGRVLEAGGLRVVRDGPALTVTHGDAHYPVDPRSLGVVLADAVRLCPDDRLAFLADAHAALPVATATDDRSVRRRRRDATILRADLARRLDERPDLAAAVDAAVARLNADPDALDAFLERQNYRLAWWRAAGRDLGYRRFFDINTLIGLRADDPLVFEDTHRLVLGWVREGGADGLRVDHIDGLGDPEQYLKRLRAESGSAWIVVEKILEGHETLRGAWPADGTTGYDFLARVGGLFIDPHGEAPFTQFYSTFTGEGDDYGTVAREARVTVLRDVLGSDVNRLAALFLDICERHRRYRDYTRHELTEALREAAAAFPVYRTYVRPGNAASLDDAAVINEALEAAEKRRPDLDPSLLHFLRDILLGRIPGRLEAELVLRFQQLTGPAMAKGVEDTAFYRYGRFVALNEVGGSPDRFGVSVEEFHAANAASQRRWPTTLLATSTHDTKRAEDVRTRLALLSEIPARWSEAVARWSALTERHRRHGWPDRVMEYVFYQTLVGAWPLSEERAARYVEKAAREAKRHTSWTAPDAAYDGALQDFVAACYRDPAFMRSVEDFVEPLVAPGRITSLAQTLLKLTAPGVPDIYQGTELWALQLVDPDNRAPVDYEERRRLLAELEDGLGVEHILARADEGLPKLWVVRQALHARRREPDTFTVGDYDPLVARGARAAHVVAFTRAGRAVTIVPRLAMTLNGDWGDTTVDLPAGTWHDVLSGDDVPGGRVSLVNLLHAFPVALLVRSDGP